ncbi:alpha-galactosidase [Fictibacillus aquaticus]|uniref:Alpha-galactosidase n=1 Tax=Fictibacillus aquaticus TaxID=2021314 RepID=A0A235F813_9BACL|nr:alpha-galactosidase [Fictibacillus aquaticus]OYD57491.1 alpha-galactosidase [Fictibacillus aquaticus]
MPIYVTNEEKRFILEGRTMAYVLEAGEKGHMTAVYWGKKLQNHDDYSKLSPDVIPHSSFESPRGVMGYDYIPWGEMVYTEPSLKVRYEDGTRALNLEFSGYKTANDDKLVITLSDNARNTEVELHYELYAEYDVIGRSQVIKNEGKSALALEAVRSLQAALPWGGDYRLSHLAGKWTGETQLQQTALTPGRKTIESRRGGTSHQANPWFALDNGANEDSGEVWSGHLAYSGNWEINIEQDTFGFVSVNGGLQSFDFEWKLDPGKSFTAPVFYISYSDEGLGGMSRKAHDFQRQLILPENHRNTARKVLYNSWEATYFDVTEEGQKKLAKKAASLGVERFVVDDGWFGERHSDSAGLGDWHVNERKFPNGLQPLIDHVHGLGMSFGIWVEPEMVNPDSDLYRQHPDWIYHFPEVERTEGRNQYVLNIGRPEVQEYILSFMKNLLSSYSIDFIKWDMNRAFSEPGWPDREIGRQKEVWVRHTEGLYRILDKLRQEFPHVEFESCSGGGARIDLGVMKRTDQVWTSDNTDAAERLSIQDGYSYAYNPKTMMCWVTDSPNWLSGRELSLAFRFRSAMAGSLGIGGNLNEWNEAELAEAKDWIAEYKKIRHIVQDGKQYRILLPQDKTAVQYVSEDGNSAVMLAFLLQQQFGERYVKLKWKGLDPHANYRLVGAELEASGSYFMQHGIHWTASGDFDSMHWVLERI